MARGRVTLVAASFALAVFSTAGFAFAAVPMLDARASLQGVLADAVVVPEQSGGADMAAEGEAAAEELAAAEEAARQERYQAAAHEFEQTCLTTRDIDNMLLICAQSLPVAGYEGGGTLHHYL